MNSRSAGGRSFVIVEEGNYDGETGYWAIDEDTQDEGFLPEFGDVFWTYDGEAYFGRRLKHGRNLKKPGKGKGKFKPRFKNRPGFQNKRRKPGKGRGYETEEVIPEEDEEAEEVDEETSLAVNGKPRFQKPKGNPKGNPPSDPSPEEKGGKKEEGSSKTQGEGQVQHCRRCNAEFSLILRH